MNLDDFTFSMLKTKYQKLRFVIVCVSPVLTYLMYSFSVYKRDYDSGDLAVYMILSPIIIYYSFKVWEWINKEDKL